MISGATHGGPPPGLQRGPRGTPCAQAECQPAAHHMWWAAGWHSALQYCSCLLLVLRVGPRTIVLAWACAPVWLTRLWSSAASAAPGRLPTAIASWLGSSEDTEAVLKGADARQPLPRGKHTTPTSPTLDWHAGSCRSLSYRLPSGSHPIGVARCPTSLLPKSVVPARCRRACLSPPPPSRAAPSPWPPCVLPCWSFS